MDSLCETCGADWATHGASACLDAAIARRVMGWRWYRNTPDEPAENYGTRFLQDPALVATMPSVFAPVVGDEPVFHNKGIPPYSTDIAAAWAVVEHLRPSWLLELVNVSGSWDEWTAFFRNPATGRHGARTAATTAPHAICLAVLAALSE